MSDQAAKRSYKKTLNLPKTSFAMKANLVQREPEFQKRWDKLELYRRMREGSHPRGTFVLHDGPPYANGPIHLGHLLNKVLKDLVVRSHCMLGYDTPFVPGWDCHGLPIEHKVVRDLGDKAREMSAPQIRTRCRSDAEKFVKLQARQMRRLGTVGEYDNPYLTMNPAYEAATLEVFADLVSRGLVYRALKPVHWSIANRTALAEAELEYEDREDTSVYVVFEIENPQDLPDSLMARPGEAISLMIWTTTPWTLPANMAVAAAPRAEYGLYRVELEDRGGLVLIARDLADHVFVKADATVDPLGVCTGADLEAAGVKYRHPFLDRVGPVVTAEYVTLEDGTGLVHTAPGHGVEDYQTGQRCGLETYCPVLEDGTFDSSAPQWLVGKSVWEGNDLVVEHLRESQNLFHAHKFTHSYPHDWRSKTPVIFRATEQWFIAVDEAFAHAGDPDGLPRKSLRTRARIAAGANKAEQLLRQREPGEVEIPQAQREWAEIEAAFLHARKIGFVPAWGQRRLEGMLESRPDWCISRQRAWGLPIPAFYGPEPGQVLLTQASVAAVAEHVREHGSDAWFRAEPPEILAAYEPGNDPDAADWVDKAALSKGHDIFDVWFESGSSWNAVLRQRGLPFPADLYLEGSDQHRGWFQLSLLPALAVTGRPPFKQVLTHGFMVDKFGKKMSKSLGNALDVDELLKDLGADICRWWVCSLNTDNDIKVDLDFFKLAGEEYRKVRNTIRFLLSNLGDFDARADRRDLTEADAASIDAWAHDQLTALVETVRDAYEKFAFRKAHEAIFHFCNQTMSAVYLSATKDRLYCDAPDSDRRRRTQTVMHDIADALVRLVAPVLVHTADEAWLSLHGLDAKGEESVHLQHVPEPGATRAHAAWPHVIELRDRVLKVLEDARGQRDLDNPLDAGVDIAIPPELFTAIEPLAEELADLCGVSRVVVEERESEMICVEDLRSEPRCERSWRRDGTVRERSDGGWLSDRDAAAVGA